MVSEILKRTVKLYHLRAYQIAQLASLHPSTLSRILNGIEQVKPNDERVIRIGRAVGLRESQCFQETAGSSNGRGLG